MMNEMQKERGKEMIVLNEKLQTVEDKAIFKRFAAKIYSSLSTFTEFIFG